MMGALDNLVKGAAGQAVQNMNLLFGFNEDEGLRQVPMFRKYTRKITQKYKKGTKNGKINRMSDSCYPMCERKIMS